MHELSVALSLVELVETEGDRLGGRVRAVHVRLGALAGLAKGALLASYEIASVDTSLKGSRLVIEEVPVIVFCPRCQAERPLSSVQWFCCSVCGTPTPDVRQGKELELIALEMEP